MSFKIVGIGEVLWDLLPDGPQLGGAPANFAYHAQVLGANASVLALGISERRVEPRAGQFSVSDYVFEPVHIDAPKARERVRGESEAIEGAAGR